VREREGEREMIGEAWTVGVGAHKMSISYANKSSICIK
jgi:hypothetical protein